MSSLYKYEIIKNKIIAEADATNNCRLPSEREICKRYGVSRNTARKALSSLNESDMVRREIGRGTFLIPSKRKSSVTLLFVNCGANMRRYLTREIKRFTESNPNIEVTPLVVNPNDAMRKARELSGAKILCAPNFGYLASVGLLAPLDLISGFDELSQTISSQYLEWNRYDLKKKSHCYSIPFSISSSACAINKRHAKTLGLKGTPKTFSEMLDWLTIAAKNKTMRGTHLSENDSRYQHMSLPFYYALSNGQPFLKQVDDKVAFDFSHGAEWFNFFKKVREIGNVAYQSTNSPFIEGEALFDYEVGSYIIRDLEEAGRLDDVEIVPFPSPKAGGVVYPRISKLSLAMVNDLPSDHHSIKAAWSFVKYIAGSKEAQSNMAKELSFLAVNREVFAEQTKDPKLRPFIEALSAGIVRNDSPVQHAVMKIVSNYYRKAVFGELSVEDAVERAKEMCALQIEIEEDKYGSSFK